MAGDYKEFAPVALFVYNRPQHTLKTIEALKSNYCASDSNLYVFSDGPKNDSDDIKRVEEVRKIISGISGFKNVHVDCSSQNSGLAQSIITGVTRLCEEFGKVIVMEDDLISSPYFLTFMNEALTHYATDNRVISVAGHVFPVDGTLPENFFLSYTSSWGWATWKRAWKHFEKDGRILLKKLKERNRITRFDFNGSYVFTKMLKQQIAKKNDSWAIRWYASTFLNDKLTLLPGTSLIHNIGNDGSGTHSGTTTKFDTSLSGIPVPVRAITVEESEKAYKLYERYFRKIRPFVLIRAKNRILVSFKKIF